jgi:hypothetical protein
MVAAALNLSDTNVLFRTTLSLYLVIAKLFNFCEITNMVEIAKTKLPINIMSARENLSLSIIAIFSDNYRKLLSSCYINNLIVV